MNGILYLYKTTIKNRIKKAIKKPVTYVMLVGVPIYVAMIIFSVNTMVNTAGLNTPMGMTVCMTVITFLVLPSNLITYTKRKGVVFKLPDVHFMMSAPVNPKLILLYGHMKNAIIGIILNIAIVILGVIAFQAPLWKMLLFFLLSVVVESMLEASLMIIVYGSEKIGKKGLLFIRYGMWVIISCVILLGIGFVTSKGITFDAMMEYLTSPFLQAVPIIGWYIAFLHLLFLGPTGLNIICSILYFAVAILLTALVFRMKSEGDYYEDAIKFAEDYAIIREKNKKGEAAIMWRKKKLGKVDIIYKGNGAKALFYRQLLEYKKNRTFIFGGFTLTSIGVGIIVIYLYYKEGFGEFTPFVIPGIMAYLTFIFTAYTGKWGKEMEKPYTYLIPDTPFRKLWYATLMEHIRSFIDGCLITILPGIVIGLSVFQITLTILLYVCLQACKMYSSVVTETLFGGIFSLQVKQLFKMFLSSFMIGIGMLGAYLGTTFISVTAGFIVMNVILILMTFVYMVIASESFEKMETLS